MRHRAGSATHWGYQESTDSFVLSLYATLLMHELYNHYFPTNRQVRGLLDSWLEVLRLLDHEWAAT
jgi:hypothetical protein